MNQYNTDVSDTINIIETYEEPDLYLSKIPCILDKYRLDKSQYVSYVTDVCKSLSIEVWHIFFTMIKDDEWLTDAMMNCISHVDNTYLLIIACELNESKVINAIELDKCDLEILESTYHELYKTKELAIRLLSYDLFKNSSRNDIEIAKCLNDDNDDIVEVIKLYGKYNDVFINYYCNNV